MLQTFVHKRPLDWPWFLPLVELYYNATEYISLGMSPYIIVYGYNVKLPVDLVAPTDPIMRSFVKLWTETKQVIEVA